MFNLTNSSKDFEQFQKFFKVMACEKLEILPLRVRKITLLPISDDILCKSILVQEVACGNCGIAEIF